VFDVPVVEPSDNVAAMRAMLGISGRVAALRMGFSEYREVGGVMRVDSLWRSVYRYA